jgi:hypothetical protein
VTILQTMGKLAIIGILLIIMPTGYSQTMAEDRSSAREAADTTSKAAGEVVSPAAEPDTAPTAVRRRAYRTHVVVYGDHLKDRDQSPLENYDSIILGARTLVDLEPRFRSRALLYFDMWGKSCYLDTGHRYTEWQPAPGEIGQDDVVLNGSVHCYRFDDLHVRRFLQWVEAFLRQWGGEVQGVFLDDFAYDRNWWSGDPAAKDLVWGPMDGRPGWREDPAGWNAERVRAIEAGALQLVRGYCGDRGVLLVNGTGRSLPGVFRFAENVGAPAAESWPRLERSGEDRYRLIRPGDYLQVNGVGATGLWGDWSVTGAGEGLANLGRAAALARERGCSVGLAYGVRPEVGGTIYQLLLDPLSEGEPWPLILNPAED